MSDDPAAGRPPLRATRRRRLSSGSAVMNDLPFADALRRHPVDRAREDPAPREQEVMDELAVMLSTTDRLLRRAAVLLLALGRGTGDLTLLAEVLAALALIAGNDADDHLIEGVL